MKKMTQKTAVSVALELLATVAEPTAEQVEAIEILTHMANKTASKSNKPTAKQLENEALRAEILSHLTDEFVDHARFVKATGLDISNQRFTAQMRYLLAEEKVVKGATDEKKVGYKLA
ncbi:MAG: hypothetical protein ACRDCA_28600 [Serratia sp. (in: enterobacteria)]|uniref:hypothetical protein n=1 Tax=Serratia sp. (in: enterobacteria) TaxID=616 RepID=UPI003F3E1EBB